MAHPDPMDIEPDWDMCEDASTLIEHREAPFPWGFVLYRTSYTPQSNILWPTVLQRIQKYAEHDYIEEHQQTRGSMHDIYKPIILNDPSLDGKSFNELRVHFNAWAPTAGIERSDIRARAFVVVDEECMRSIANAPEIPENCAYDDRTQVVFKLVDPDFDPSLPKVKPGQYGTIAAKRWRIWRN